MLLDNKTCASGKEVHKDAFGPSLWKAPWGLQCLKTSRFLFFNFWTPLCAPASKYRRWELNVMHVVDMILYAAWCDPMGAITNICQQCWPRLAEMCPPGVHHKTWCPKLVNDLKQILRSFRITSPPVMPDPVTVLWMMAAGAWFFNVVGINEHARICSARSSNLRVEVTHLSYQ